MLIKQLRNKKYTRVYLGLAITFIVILIGMLSSVLYLRSYNTLWRSAKVEDLQSEKNISFSLAPRSGYGASWTKRPQVGESYGNEYTGMTMDASIENLGRGSVTEWMLRVEAPDDYYLNNAWNGTVEVHQFRNGAENVQTLNLLNAKYKDITLSALEIEGDILIEQKTGDYIIYHPNENEKDLASEEAVLVGFNVYFPGKVYFAPDFPSCELIYKRTASLTDIIAWNVFIVLLLGWLLAFANVIMMIANDMGQEKDRSRTMLLMDDIMGVCGKLIEAKETQAGVSSKEMAGTAVAIARKLGIGDEDTKLLYYATLLHNCGNMSLPDSLLAKRDDELTPEEIKILTQHTLDGYDMLKDISSIPLAKEAAKYHHERWDGKGYPEGLKEDEIPKIARIVAVANTFEDIKSRAKQKGEASQVDFITAFTVKSGKELDPSMCEVVIDMIKNNEINVE